MKNSDRNDKSYLEVKGLRLQTRLGFYPEDRAEKREVLADIRYTRSLQRSIKSDMPKDSVDWNYILTRVERIVGANSYCVAERLAAHICEIIFADQHVKWVEVAVHTSGKDNHAELLTTRHYMEKKSHYGPQVSKKAKRASSCARLQGIFTQALGYLVHLVLRKKRWIMPSVSPADGPLLPEGEKIPRIIWQTNFSAACTFPLWQNYRRNRRLSKGFEHRYVSTEEREEYVKKHTSERIYKAYSRLTDGAAQADLWRIIVLYEEGGVYIDFDGTLTRPLADILRGRSDLFLWDRKRTTNYFIASCPKNPIIKACIDKAVENIENYPKENGPSVFFTTGPSVFEHVLDSIPGVDYVPRQAACIQGAFANEFFQYMDRPRSKWTYKKTFIQG